jgi:lysyl endopeptidase
MVKEDFSNRGMPIAAHLILLLMLMLSSPAILGQLPHGFGRPLAEGTEKTSLLSSSVDYFVEMKDFDTDSAKSVSDLPANRVGGLRFAHTFYTDLSPENSGLVYTTEDGTRIWKVGIRSNGAYSLNVIFSTFQLPEGAKVFLYNPDRSMVSGPFTKENQTESGEFSVAPIDGDELIVEYQEPAEAPFSGKLRISEVKHDYRGLSLRTSPRFNSLYMPCQPDVSCNSTYDTLKHSVCLLIINGDTYCTGTFVNNTAQDGKPYLITAAHCLNNDMAYGSRIVAFLNYESPSCDPRIRGSEEFSIAGSTCRALSNEIDFALIEFKEPPPSDYQMYLAGWSLDTLTRNNLPFTCLHHPNGDTRKYCVEEDTVSTADWPSGLGILPGFHWNVRQWEIGHTWYGSSGAGLFDKHSRLSGILSGGSSGGLFGCGTYEIGDFFARIDKAWAQYSDVSKQLKHWLDPLTPDSLPSTIIGLDGLDPNASNPARRISNIHSEDSLESISVTNGWGSIFGHNSLNTTNFCEHFSVADSSMILGIYLVALKGSYQTDRPIYVHIYEGGDATPGKILSRKVLNPNYLDYVNSNFTRKKKAFFTNRENYLRFSHPVSAGTDFFVGYEIPYPLEEEADTFQLYGVLRTGSINTAFFKQDNLWYPYTEHPTNPISTSLWIESVIANDTVTTASTGSFIFDMTPKIAWSNSESTLTIAFPEEWTGKTFTEIFDLSGRVVLRTTLYPPIDVLPFRNKSPRLYLIRLNNGKYVATLKALIGFE